MARKKERLERIVSILREEKVGLRQGTIARRLGEHPQAVARALVQLDDRGILLQEDDWGRISLMQA